MAAILALPDRQPFGIHIGRTGIGGRRRERMVAELLGGLGEDQSGLRHDQRLVGIVVGPRAFERIAPSDHLAAQIAGLAGGAAQLFEPVVMRLQVVIGDAPVLDRHVVRNGVAAVPRRQMRTQHELARQEAPGDAVPVGTGAAEAVADRGDIPLAHRQRHLVRGVAQRVGLHSGVLHQLLAHPVFQLVTDARQREILRRHFWRAALQADDGKARLGEFARHDAAGPSHADHHGIDGFHNFGHDRCPS